MEGREQSDDGQHAGARQVDDVSGQKEDVLQQNKPDAGRETDIQRGAGPGQGDENSQACHGDVFPPQQPKMGQRGPYRRGRPEQLHREFEVVHAHFQPSKPAVEANVALRKVASAIHASGSQVREIQNEVRSDNLVDGEKIHKNAEAEENGACVRTGSCPILLGKPRTFFQTYF